MNKIVAIVPAAGSGKRFSDEVPKQFLKISEKSILELSIRPLLDFSDCLGVCVVVPPEDQYHKSLDVIQNPKVFRLRWIFLYRSEGGAEPHPNGCTFSAPVPAARGRRAARPGSGGGSGRRVLW